MTGEDKSRADAVDEDDDDDDDDENEDEDEVAEAAAAPASSLVGVRMLRGVRAVAPNPAAGSAAAAEAPAEAHGQERETCAWSKAWPGIRAAAERGRALHTRRQSASAAVLPPAREPTCAVAGACGGSYNWRTRCEGARSDLISSRSRRDRA